MGNALLTIISLTGDANREWFALEKSLEEQSLDAKGKKYFQVLESFIANRKRFPWNTYLEANSSAGVRGISV